MSFTLTPGLPLGVWNLGACQAEVSCDRRPIKTPGTASPTTSRKWTCPTCCHSSRLGSVLCDSPTRSADCASCPRVLPRCLFPVLMSCCGFHRNKSQALGPGSPLGELLGLGLSRLRLLPQALSAPKASLPSTHTSFVMYLDPPYPQWGLGDWHLGSPWAWSETQTLCQVRILVGGEGRVGGSAQFLQAPGDS